MKPKLGVLLAVVCLFALLAAEISGAARRKTQPEAMYPIAKMFVNGSDVWFEAVAEFSGLRLSWVQPDGTVMEKSFLPGEVPHISVSADMPTGVYAYELRAAPAGAREQRSEKGAERTGPSAAQLVQNGSFYVDGGKVLTDEAGAASEPLFARAGSGPLFDVVYTDDVIMRARLAVGNGAQDGEVFNTGDTMKIKAYDTRLTFEDVSTADSGYPGNVWRLTPNDYSPLVSGGMNYFAIDDLTNGTSPFKILAAAPSSSLFVDQTGRVGLRTATPAKDLHVKTGDTPTFRLEQTAGMWPAQTWDIGGNEGAFFVRNPTTGAFPFEIEPNAPTFGLFIDSTGNIGAGTGYPNYALEVKRTGVNSAVVTTRTDGASNYMNATATFANFGSVNNFPLRLMVNGTWRFRLNTDNSLSLVNGAGCTAGGVWLNASSREYKDNISGLSAAEAVETLEGLSPVKFNYKADDAEKHVGFIAEDVPDLVASNDGKSLSPMDIVAVLTKVVQEQQQRISELSKKVSELEAKNR